MHHFCEAEEVTRAFHTSHSLSSAVTAEGDHQSTLGDAEGLSREMV